MATSAARNAPAEKPIMPTLPSLTPHSAARSRTIASARRPSAWAISRPARIASSVTSSENRRAGFAAANRAVMRAAVAADSASYFAGSGSVGVSRYLSRNAE